MTYKALKIWNNMLIWNLIFGIFFLHMIIKETAMTTEYSVIPSQMHVAWMEQNQDAEIYKMVSYLTCSTA